MYLYMEPLRIGATEKAPGEEELQRINEGLMAVLQYNKSTDRFEFYAEDGWHILEPEEFQIDDKPADE